jgi:hypothetical protein
MATPERPRRALHADAPTSQLHESLGPQPQDVGVRKTRVGAFTTTYAFLTSTIFPRHTTVVDVDDLQQLWA